VSDPDLSGLFARNPDIVERRVGESLFLAEAEGEAIFRLNETGTALWRLLAEPAGLIDAAQIFHQAFPERDYADIEAELSDLLSKLQKRGLIVRAG
jgi:hypothetical protein